MSRGHRRKSRKKPPGKIAESLKSGPLSLVPADPEIQAGIDGELYTDVGNAKRLVWIYGQEIRWVSGWEKWLLWDGRRWKKDEHSRIVEFAKKTIRDLHKRASIVTDDHQRREAIRFTLEVERSHRIRAMIELARSEIGIAITPRQLDSDPWLLNCLNGTINLKTGELLAHDPKDLISKIASTEFDPNAQSDVWRDFLRHVSGNNVEIQDYLQRTAGYSLTGVTSEEILLLVVGGPATGKTTYLESLKATMGEYAATANPGSFLRQKNAGGPRPDLARLHGSRLVTASEVPPGMHLDEVTVKQLTGGDTVVARHLYKEEFEFRPQFKIIIAGNHRPSVRDDDPAIWRRIRLIPFDQELAASDRDPRIKEQLSDPSVSGPAILAWMVEGVKKWRAEGLREPAEVSKATAAYRSETEIFPQFIADCCIEGPGNWAPISGLMDSYRKWCAAQGNDYPYGHRRVTRMLKDRGCVSRRRNQTRGWQGIGLLADNSRGRNGQDGH